MTDQKRKNLMAYISVSKMLLEGTFLKRNFLFRKYLMDYQKKEILMAYISNFLMVLTLNFLKKKFPFLEIISKKGNFDGLYILAPDHGP